MVAALATITVRKRRTIFKIAQLMEGTGASSLTFARKDSVMTTMEILVSELKRMQMEIGAQLLTCAHKAETKPTMARHAQANAVQVLKRMQMAIAVMVKN